MTNPIIPEAEVNAVKKVIEAVEELKEVHNGFSPIFNGSEDDLVKLHTFAYLHFFKELIGSSVAIKDLLEVSREDFEKTATNNGEREVFEVLRNVTISELLDRVK